MASAVFGVISVIAGAPQTMPLWPEGNVPNAKGTVPADIPDITIYLPPAETATGAAVLICPGGGYGGLCSSYEGHDIAKWLNGYGIAGVVLKYRLKPYTHPVPIQDAQRAMRLIRLNAKTWGIDSARIGVMGFSAGGHLASTLGTHFDAGDSKASEPLARMSCRPDFMILVYPVINNHKGSMTNLLGPNPSKEDLDNLANDKQVTADTPMTFITHSIKDATVPVDNSRDFRDALKAKGVSVEYFELPKGAHGLGCGKGEDWQSWQTECVKWLKAKKLANEK